MVLWKEIKPKRAKRFLKEGDKRGEKTFLLKNNFMLPKENRLKGVEIEQLLKTNKKPVFSSSFSLIIGKKNINKTQFGFVVSTKISKKAVKRNKVKRLLRKIVRELLPNIKNGYQVVVLTKRSIVDKKENDLKKEFEKSLNSHGLIK